MYADSSGAWRAGPGGWEGSSHCVLTIILWTLHGQSSLGVYTITSTLWRMQWRHNDDKWVPQHYLTTRRQDRDFKPLASNSKIHTISIRSPCLLVRGKWESAETFWGNVNQWEGWEMNSRIWQEGTAYRGGHPLRGESGHMKWAFGVGGAGCGYDSLWWVGANFRFGEKAKEALLPSVWDIRNDQAKK